MLCIFQPPSSYTTISEPLQSGWTAQHEQQDPHGQHHCATVQVTLQQEQQPVKPQHLQQLITYTANKNSGLLQDGWGSLICGTPFSFVNNKVAVLTIVIMSWQHYNEVWMPIMTRDIRGIFPQCHQLHGNIYSWFFIPMYKLVSKVFARVGTLYLKNFYFTDFWLMPLLVGCTVNSFISISRHMLRSLML